MNNPTPSKADLKLAEEIAAEQIRIKFSKSKPNKSTDDKNTAEMRMTLNTMISQCRTLTGIGVLTITISADTTQLQWSGDNI